MLGVNSYVVDGGNSIKSSFKLIWPSGMPPLPPYATFGATVEPTIDD